MGFPGAGQEDDDGTSSDESNGGQSDKDKDEDDKDEKEDDGTKAASVLDRLNAEVESAKSDLEAAFSQDDKQGRTSVEDGEKDDEMGNNEKQKDEELMDDSDLFTSTQNEKEEKGKAEEENEDEFIDGEHLDGDGLVTSAIMGGGSPR